MWRCKREHKTRIEKANWLGHFCPEARIQIEKAGFCPNETIHQESFANDGRAWESEQWHNAHT